MIKHLQAKISKIPSKLIDNIAELSNINEQVSKLCKDEIRICVTGGMKSGKSYMLNAMLQEQNSTDLSVPLPTAKTPCTARITRIVASNDAKYYMQVGNCDKVQLSGINDARINKEINLTGADRLNTTLISHVVSLYMPNKLLENGIELFDLLGKNENPALDDLHTNAEFEL